MAEKPIVIDSRCPATRSTEFMFWLADHGILPKDCYKVEVFPLEHKIISYCYKRNERDSFYIDVLVDPHNPVCEPPQTVDMKSPLPQGDYTSYGTA